MVVLLAYGAPSIATAHVRDELSDPPSVILAPEKPSNSLGFSLR